MRIFIAMMALVLVASTVAFVLSFQACDDKASGTSPGSLIQIDDGDAENLEIVDDTDVVGDGDAETTEDTDGIEDVEQQALEVFDSTESASVEFIIFDEAGRVRHNGVVTAAL